jgi:hypothetical protein
VTLPAPAAEVNLPRGAWGANNLEAAKRDEHVPLDLQTGALAARLGEIREQLEAIESALRAAHDVPAARRPE